jgi:hypothetical protein
LKIILLVAGVVVVISLLVVFLVVPVFAQGKGTSTLSRQQDIICPVTNGNCQGCFQGTTDQSNQITFDGKNTVIR